MVRIVNHSASLWVFGTQQPARGELRRLRHQGAQADLTHQRRQARAEAVGLILQGLQVLFGETHQHLACQLPLLAVCSRLPPAFGGCPCHFVVMPQVYDIDALK